MYQLSLTLPLPVGEGRARAKPSSYPGELVAAVLAELGARRHRTTALQAGLGALRSSRGPHPTPSDYLRAAARGDDHRLPGLALAAGKGLGGIGHAVQGALGGLPGAL